MTSQARWDLGPKLALVAAPFFAAAVLFVAATLSISWLLYGGAAALNEAGRMRMQIFRLFFSISARDDPTPVAQRVMAFEKSIALLYCRSEIAASTTAFPFAPTADAWA